MGGHAHRGRRTTTLDSLGVFDPQSFEERLQLELRRAERYFVFLSVLLVDVECVDWRRGRWRPRARRDYLTDAARILQANTRDIDTLFAFDRDRFAFLLPETNDEGAREAAQRLARLVEGAKVPRLGRWARLRAAFGIASFPSDARNKTQLLARGRRSLKSAMAERRRRRPEPPRGRR